MGIARVGSLGGFEAKGDFLVFDGVDLQRLPVGPTRQALVADPAQPTGLGYVSVGSVLDCSNVATTIAGTAAETTLYSVVIPANTLGAKGILQVRIVGTFVANVLGGASYTLRVKFGGTTIYEDNSPLVGLSGALRAFYYNLKLANRNNTAIQTGGGSLRLSALAAASVGTGNFGVPDVGSSAARFAASAIDTTLAQTFELTVQHSSADSGVVTTRELAYAIVSPTP